MKLIQFENDPPKTKFAPVFDYWVYENFVDIGDLKSIILSKEKENLIFLLWGRFAQNKAEIIDNEKHYILTAAHPSPFSAHSGFFGCKHFSKTNEILKKLNQKQIKWVK